MSSLGEEFPKEQARLRVLLGYGKDWTRRYILLCSNRGLSP